MLKVSIQRIVEREYIEIGKDLQTILRAHFLVPKSGDEILDTYILSPHDGEEIAFLWGVMRTACTVGRHDLGREACTLFCQLGAGRAIQIDRSE